MFGFKKTSPVAATPRVTVQDGAIAEAWGLTPLEWAGLSNNARVAYRDRVAFAGRPDGFGRPLANTEGK